MNFGEDFWLEKLGPYLDVTNNECIVEVARLLDDVLESVVIMSGNIENVLKGNNKSSWTELYRQASHVKDHFDYAEHYVISCVREERADQL
jgi:hypothetical protein